MLFSYMFVEMKPIPTKTRKPKKVQPQNAVVILELAMCVTMSVTLMIVYLEKTVRLLQFQSKLPAFGGGGCVVA